MPQLAVGSTPFESRKQSLNKTFQFERGSLIDNSQRTQLNNTLEDTTNEEEAMQKKYLK